MPLPSGKNCLRDKLEDDVLDISLMQLTEVPVDELALLPKGTTLDMSNNLLVRLPENFPILVHLVKLDLSKNRLVELPEYFGQLKNLRHLDLYSNQLERLPLSFAQLSRLRWLDLKNNPLVPALQQAAGPCITAAECQQCAKKVVNIMQNVRGQAEKERQRIALEEREEDERRALLEQQERQRIRAEKKAAKEKRKLLSKKATAAEENLGSSAVSWMESEPSDGSSRNGGDFQLRLTGSSRRGKDGRSGGCCWTLLKLLFTAALLVAGAGISMLWIYTGGRLDQRSVERAVPMMWRDIDAWAENTNQRAWVLTKTAHSQALPAWRTFERNFWWLVEELERRNKFVAHYLNENLGLTFCCFKKTIWEQWGRATMQLNDAWASVKPYLLDLRDSLFVLFRLLRQRLEIYLPKAFDFVCDRCFEFASWLTGAAT